VEDRILIQTPAALYRFLPDSETRTVTTTNDGLPGIPYHGFSLAGDDLWISGDGVSVSDVRFDDWQRYGPGEGYPGRFVYDVEADEDYAYAGTDEGAARFDQYILEWETLLGPEGTALGPVLDVAVGDDRVWFALEDGVAEYRKQAESFRIDSQLGTFSAPRVLALRQTTRHVWAFTEAGIARYDKQLESWISYRVGAEFPDARVRQFTLEGDDLWLGTDRGLWHYIADSGIWRRDESGEEMPGEKVLAFTLDPDRIWVVTEQAFAVYEQEEARWIDFTSSVPLNPQAVVEMEWTSETLLFLTSETTVYGLSYGRDNPSVFIYRRFPVRQLDADEAVSPDSGMRWKLDDSGLGVQITPDAALTLKGGATLFVEDEDSPGESGLGDLVSDTRLDLTLSGRFGEDRTLSGFYDSTDPENTAYQLTYRGARDDNLRVLSGGEIEQQLFNSELTPGTGLTGGRIRAELGSRTETTRRRLLTADAWVGERRTRPGGDVFYGGNRLVESSTRDIDYLRGLVFPAPEEWSTEDLTDAVVYLDDDDSATDDANTEYRELAGQVGSWDRLAPNVDYVIGSGGRAILLTTPLGPFEELVAVRSVDGAAVDLTGSGLRNHYWIALEPVPGSLELAIVDTTGSTRDVSGIPYLRLFGLDTDGDGWLDPERFSPVSGILSFPDSLPFPAEVYSASPTNLYTMEYTYQATLNTFRLSHGDVVPGSERITADRELLRPDIDYSIIPASGLFIFYEHVLLDEDTVIEVDYEYEVGEDAEKGTVVAGQLGLAPNEHVFLGVNSTRWEDIDTDADMTTTDVNARLEWKDEQRFFRVTPEVALSRHGRPSCAQDEPACPDGKGRATGIGLQGRYRGLEVSASRRDLDRDYTSFEDRQTLLGMLREESRAYGRLNMGRHLQAELEWEKSLSDQLTGTGISSGTAASASGIDPDALGEESSLMGTVRLLRSGLPNLEFRRGQVVLDAAGQRQEKQISRAELEISPDQAGVTIPRINRLWLRAFFQRSERETTAEGDSASTDLAARRITDHAFARLNGSMGSPLSWNVAVEDRRTHVAEGDQNLRRFQEVDATLHSQPHSSLDAFLRWESSRNLFWHPAGGPGGFDVERLLLGTFQFYPGRLARSLSLISFRFDVGNNENEQGEPGIGLPDAGSLWSESADASQRRQTGTRVTEARLQLLSWLRLVERWETESDLFAREALETESETRRLENRLELDPRGGLVILRLIGTTTEEGRAETRKRRFSGQWDQTWGHGIITYVSMEAQRTEMTDRNVGDVTELWNPQAQVTLRRSEWQLDATLAGSLTWNRVKDTSVGSMVDWDTIRSQVLTTSLSIHPTKILTVKMEYSVNRAETSAKLWETNHDLRVRLQLRA
jgi:hypothetical protein